MTVADAVCDVLIIGAGPAGATSARLLATWGWSVVMLQRPLRASSPTLAESLPPSIRKALRLSGQLDAVEAAGFHPNDGNVAQWANAARVTRTPDAGFHVSRGDFDAVLRRGARAAGALIIDGVVRGIEGRDPIRVTYATADGRLARCRARYVLDCSGRAGVVARRGARADLHRELSGRLGVVGAAVLDQTAVYGDDRSGPLA